MTCPKNATVAAAGARFEATRVKLAANPGVMANIHEIQASGDFGEFLFRIEGHALPDKAALKGWNAT